MSSNAVAVATVGIACRLGGGIGIRDSSSQSASMLAVTSEVQLQCRDYLVRSVVFFSMCRPDGPWCKLLSSPTWEYSECGHRSARGTRLRGSYQTIWRWDFDTVRDLESKVPNSTVEARLKMPDATKLGTVGLQLQCMLPARNRNGEMVVSSRDYRQYRQVYGHQCYLELESEDHLEQ